MTSAVLNFAFAYACYSGNLRGLAHMFLDFPAPIETVSAPRSSPLRGEAISAPKYLKYLGG
jgi:hypothetical protein